MLSLHDRPVLITNGQTCSCMICVHFHIRNKHSVSQTYIHAACVCLLNFSFTISTVSTHTLLSSILHAFPHTHILHSFRVAVVHFVENLFFTFVPFIQFVLLYCNIVL